MAPAYFVDLHNHTPHVPNDYRGRRDTTPAEIVSAVLEAGLEVFAVSDHFSVGFYRRVRDAVRAHEGDPDLLVLPAAELKVTWGSDEAHLIAIFPAGREDLFPRLLAALDVRDRPESVFRLASFSIERDPVEVARAIEGLGGMCSLAHVDRWFGDYRLMDSALLDRLVAEAPLVAVEVLDPDHCAALCGRLAGVACIQASDSHSLAEIGRSITALTMPELSFEGLRAGLRAEAAARRERAGS